MTDAELARRLQEARDQFEQLDAERKRRDTIAWAIKILFGGGR